MWQNMKMLLNVHEIHGIEADSEETEEEMRFRKYKWLLKNKEIQSKYDKMSFINFGWWVHRCYYIFLCTFLYIKRNDWIRKCLIHRGSQKCRHWVCHCYSVLFTCQPTAGLSSPQPAWLHSCPHFSTALTLLPYGIWSFEPNFFT